MIKVRKSLLVLGLLLLAGAAWGQEYNPPKYTLIPWAGEVLSEGGYSEGVGPTDTIWLPSDNLPFGAYGYSKTGANCVRIYGPNNRQMSTCYDIHDGQSHIDFTSGAVPNNFNFGVWPDKSYGYTVHFYIEITYSLPEFQNSPYTWQISGCPLIKFTQGNYPLIFIPFFYKPFFGNNSSGSSETKGAIIQGTPPGNCIVAAQFDLQRDSCGYIQILFGITRGSSYYADHYDGTAPHYEWHNIDVTPTISSVNIWYAEDEAHPDILETPFIGTPNDSNEYYTNQGSTSDDSVTISIPECQDIGTLVHENGGWTVSGIGKYYIYKKSGESYAEIGSIDSSSITFLQTAVNGATIKYFNSTINLPEGEHQICIKTEDKAGNKSEHYSSISTIRVDRTAPDYLTAADAVYTLKDNNGGNITNKARPSLTCEVYPQDNGIIISNINRKHFNMYFEDLSDLDRTITGNLLENTLLEKKNGEPLPDGTYGVAIRYYDNAGNINTYTIGGNEYYTFTIDRTKPPSPGSLTIKTTDDGKPLPILNDIYQTYKSRVTLGWAASSDLNGITNYSIYTADGHPVNITENNETSIDLTLVNGDNGFYITATDAAGNVSEPSSLIRIKKYNILLPVTFPKSSGEAVTYDSLSIPTIHWNSPENAEGMTITYTITVLHQSEVKKTYENISSTSHTLTGLATKFTYTAVVYAKDSIGRTSENRIVFTPGNVAVRIGPGRDYDILGPANGQAYANAASVPGFTLTGTSPRHDSEGDIVLHKLYYRKIGASEFNQYPEADGEYTQDDIGLTGLSKGTYEWYMEIAEFYDPGSGVPNKYDSKQRWPVTTTETLTFSVAENIVTAEGYSDTIRTTPGKQVRFDAATYTDYTGAGYEYLWDFGDIAISTDTNTTHAFSQAIDPITGWRNATSSYDVMLYVKDNTGSTIETAKVKVIVENTTRGTLYADEEWSAIHPLYGSVTIPAGIKLIVHSGTSVTAYGTGDTTLYINGRLEAWGNDATVQFRSAIGTGNTEWQGIVITGSAEISHCEITNAKRGITCANTALNAVTIGSTTFTNNLAGLHSYNSMPIVGSCMFADNAWYGIKEDNPLGDVHPIVTGTVFSGNGYDYYHSTLKNISIMKLNELNAPEAGNSTE